MKKSVEIKDPYLLILADNDICEGEGKKTKRYIFDHGVTFNAYEMAKIKKLKAQAEEVLSKNKFPKWMLQEFRL